MNGSFCFVSFSPASKFTFVGTEGKEPAGELGAVLVAEAHTADDRDTSPSGITEEYALTTDPDARLQKLIRRLQSPHDLKRIHAGLLLGRMGPAASEAVPTLLELLQGESIQHRKLAAWTLGYIGQEAVAAMPALLVAVRDTDEGVRKMAREALEKISPAGTQARGA